MNKIGAVGTIHHRLLINRWVDPEEVVDQLPPGVRPHLGSTGGVIVGCCLIEIGNLRPPHVPASLGLTVRAAAYRISCEVGSASNPTRAVFVPRRLTDSWTAVAAGGWLSPGVHQRAGIGVDHGTVLRWRVVPADSRSRDRAGADTFGLEALATTSGRPADSEVAEIVVGTRLGLSPGRRPERLEAAEMVTATTDASRVDLRHLDAPLFEAFTTAEPADTLLMIDVPVRWTPATAPI